MQTHAMPSAELASAESGQREKIFDAFRRWGYVRADLDPLGNYVGEEHPELNLTGPLADEARRIYCGTVGAEFMHMPDPERREWVRERMESEPEPVDRERILTQLVEADVFEQMLQTLYIGTKRFSLEGDERADSVTGGSSASGGRARRRRMRDGHEPSRTPQRGGAHRGTPGG